MWFVNTAISALLNFFLLAGLPYLHYFVWQKVRHRRGWREVALRAGLQLGERRYLGYSLVFGFVVVSALVIWRPALEPFTRIGSPQKPFVGLGFGVPTMVMALLYGVIKTGLTEELLFRGLIAGNLARRFPLWLANLLQALLFLLPHWLAIRLMPELRGLLLLIFLGALFLGWIRHQSGSIIGPWLVHASLNVTMCLEVAIRGAH